MDLQQQRKHDQATFIEQLIKVTKDLALQHGNPISDDTAWTAIQDIVVNNYPKCCVKYLTGQQWRL